MAHIQNSARGSLGPYEILKKINGNALKTRELTTLEFLDRYHYHGHDNEGGVASILSKQTVADDLHITDPRTFEVTP